MLVKACKPALESSYITKVIHDCKRDSEIAFSLIEEQEGQLRSPNDYISFVSLLKFVFNQVPMHSDYQDCNCLCEALQEREHKTIPQLKDKFPLVYKNVRPPTRKLKTTYKASMFI
ncbi:uncharacterized protein LOC21386943 [Morus notabilis]|uniref:uncharacterized protein LOC21386943 n=1 Tax=Morus notabilis TaxID=981085 RepID=UPI000CED7186|nr:uncharacterized protein LOC21386943 [Morus notabilis]